MALGFGRGRDASPPPRRGSTQQRAYQGAVHACKACTVHGAAASGAPAKRPSPNPTP